MNVCLLAAQVGFRGMAAGSPPRGTILDPLPVSWSVIPFSAWSNSLIEPNRSSTSRAIAFWQIQSSAGSSPRRIDDGAGGLDLSSFMWISNAFPSYGRRPVRSSKRITPRL